MAISTGQVPPGQFQGIRRDRKGNSFLALGEDLFVGAPARVSSLLHGERTKGPFRYERHRPETTPLYRLVHQYHRQLWYEWMLRYQTKYGSLRYQVTGAFERYLECGILENGCARACCPDCNHSIVVVSWRGAQ